MKNESGLEPVGGAVLLKPYVIEGKTAGGIIIPEESRKKDQMAEQRAVIVAIGEYAWHNEPGTRARVGDKVLFSKWAGYSAIGPADHQEYRVVNGTDIFMRITHKE